MTKNQIKSRQAFSGYPEFRYIGNDLSKLLSDFTYTPPESSGYKPVFIKAGFITDLVSSPGPIRWLIHKYGDSILGALPHDYLYHTQLRSRKESDYIMKLAMEDADSMEEYSIPKWRRVLIYTGLRIGGWYQWNKRAKEINKIRKQLENDGMEKNEKDNNSINISD